MSDLADLRRRVRQAIQDAKRQSAARREARDAASATWATAVGAVVEPVATDVAAALTGEGLPFKLETPRGSVRLVSERSADDYIEIALDDSDERDSPEVIGRSVLGRGRQGVTVVEETLGPPADLSADRLTSFFMDAIGPWIR